MPKNKKDNVEAWQDKVDKSEKAHRAKLETKKQTKLYAALADNIMDVLEGRSYWTKHRALQIASNSVFFDEYDTP